MMLLSVLWALVLPGCFDDTVTQGLDCENDLECGKGQACGPEAAGDDGPATPDMVCGVPQDEGWEVCDSNDSPTCRDFETTLTCRNGFWTPTDCDTQCESQVGSLRGDGICGAEDPDLTDCACAYAVDPSASNAADCYETDAGEDSLQLVRSKTFASDDVAAYLQTCDEWCADRSQIPSYAGSLCGDTVEATLSLGSPLVATAVSTRLVDTEPCVCRLAVEPDCSGDPPVTRCLENNGGVSALTVCAPALTGTYECLRGCDPLTVPGMDPIDWCL